MSDQSNPITYVAPPGVELRKALVPYDHAATLRALEIGVVGNVGQINPEQCVRAPATSGPQQIGARAPATQGNVR
jgi:hypothetical protein